jgi:hypothetical protein
MALLKSNQGKDCFRYTLSGDELAVFSNLENHECHFVIADKEGFVLLKGRFIDKKQISLPQLNVSEIELVLFNEECRRSYPVKIK